MRCKTKTSHIQCSIFAATVFFSLGLGLGCGDDSAGASPEYYVRATVTLTDGQVLSFEEACVVTQSEIMGESIWGIEAKDISVPVGIIFTWKEDYVSGPATYDANEGVNDFSTMIARQHPTDPGMIRMSGASTGTVTFTQIDYTAGGLIEGTFADVRLDRDEPDDTVHIVFADGSFHCRVE